MRCLVPLLLLTACSADVSKRNVRFDKHVLDERFFAEGVAVFDVNDDARVDIVSGEQWFEAPDFTPHAIGTVSALDPATEYSRSFVSYPMDVDADGRIDLVTFGFPLYPAFWKRNIGADQVWPEYTLWAGAPQESPRIATIGVQVAIFHPDATHIGLFTPAADLSAPWTPRLLELPSTVPPLGGHGLGVGDLDGDGRLDLITTRGFWSMPAAIDDLWPFTAVELGPDCAQMHVVDVNADGLADVITSSAHGVGVWWHEQRRTDGAMSFVRHTISEEFSQSHALEIADLDGDGLLDIVTGKRMWAHGPGGDIDPEAPKVLYWFEQVQDNGARFIPHLIDDDSGVGVQFVVTDVNGDSRPDIVTASKRGTFYFEQR